MLSLSTIANVNLAFAMGALQSAMDIREVRRLALKHLMHNAPEKTIAGFATAHSVDPTYLSQLLNGHRNMGEKSARKLEVKLGIETGYLDLLPEGVTAAIQNAQDATELSTAPPPAAMPQDTAPINLVTSAASPRDFWPFTAPRAMYEALSADDKAYIDETITDLIEVRFARAKKAMKRNGS